MRITPMVIVVMTAMSFNPGFSNLKKNAKTKTKANVELLHSATINPKHTKTGNTVESQRDKLQRRVRQPDI